LFLWGQQVKARSLTIKKMVKRGIESSHGGGRDPNIGTLGNLIRLGGTVGKLDQG